MARMSREARSATRKRLRRIAELERRLKKRLELMCRGVRLFAQHRRDSRPELVELARLRPWEVRRLPGWDEYVQSTFAVGERQLYRAFAAARVEALISDPDDQGMTNGQFSDLPESIIRPLTANDFTDAERRQIWGEAIAAADGARPTGAGVQEAAQAHRRNRAFEMLSHAEQKKVIEIEQRRRDEAGRRAQAGRDAGLAEKALDYFAEAWRCYERALGFVRRAGKRIIRIEDGTRRILDHVRAAMDGTRELLADRRAASEEPAD